MAASFLAIEVSGHEPTFGSSGGKARRGSETQPRGIGGVGMTEIGGVEERRGEATRSRVVVVGSLNMDLVVRTPRLPAPGETILGKGFATVPGGKGANQAVAAARMGARVSIVGRVGSDGFGQEMRAALAREGIDTRLLLDAPGAPTGIASIWVDDHGANSIVVTAGANAALSPGDIERSAALLTPGAVVLVQLEIPPETVEYLLSRAADSGANVLLDPAPVHPQATKWLGDLWAVAPNQVEAEALVGFAVRSLDDGARAALALLDGGARVAVVKMAAQGSVAAWRAGAGSGVGTVYHVPPLPVEPVDTTAAGDAFCGALAAGITAGLGLLDACTLASAAAGLSTMRPGAQPSLPTLDEARSALARHADSMRPRPLT